MESHADRTGERAPRGGNTQKQDGEEEDAAAENRDLCDLPKPREPRAAASTRAAEEPPRLNFHIPRRNKENRALFQSLSSESREFAEILNVIISNYKDPSSRGNFVYSEPRLVHNEPLEKEFIEKRRELKQDGRTEKELAESFCFLLCDSNRVPLVCEKGLSVGSSWLNTLGHFTKGVYLCQYSDLLQANPHEPGSTGKIVIFKVIKGKVKSIYEKAKCSDPTPKFDSHFSKNATRVTSLQAFKAFEFTQQYFYEYVDFELASRPRHVCPYAVVSFQFRGKEAITVGAKPLPQQRSNSMSSGIGTESSGYTVWKGHFVNKSKEVYQASLRSPSHPFLPFKLPERIEIGKVMRLHQVKEVIPPAVFSWNVYLGSHEVFRNGMHCCLFEVVDKSKPGDSLTELFQKLEESELVLVTPVNDQGFLFLLSSGQMSNLSVRWSGWKKSCLQALFAYRQSRDVSRLTSGATADRVPLTPLPEDPVMPKLDCFVPGLHNVLNKMRSTFPANPTMAVEQQVCEYFSNLPESGHDLRTRLDYDKKLDNKEKVFAAPRQRFNWESYMRPYMYSPNLFTMPVEKAKEMVENLVEIPEPNANPSTTDKAEDQSNVEKMMELIKVIQLKKNLKEAELMETQAVASHVYSQKRKLEEEVQEYSSKCLKLGNGEREVNLLNVLGVIGLQDTDLRTDRPQEVLKVVELLDGLSKAAMDVDLREDSMQNVLISKVLEDLNKTLCGTSTTDAEGAEEKNSSEDVQISLQESLTKMGLPANCDTDLRERFVDDEEEEENKNPVVQEKADLEEETTNSLSSLEAFSPCSETNGLQRSHAPGERSIPWVLIPITGLKTERYSYRGDTSVDDPRFVQSPTVSTQTNPEKKSEPASDSAECIIVEPEPESECPEDKEPAPEPADVTVSSSMEQTAPDGTGDTPDRDVDSIVDEHISAFSTEVEEMLRGEHVSYVPYSGTEVPKTPAQMQILPFSEYVSHFNTPSHVQNYIDLFRDSVSAFIYPKEETCAGTLQTSSSVSDALHQPAFTSTALTSAPTSSISSSGLVHSEQQHISIPGLNISTSDIQKSMCIDELEHKAPEHAGNGLPKDSAVACGSHAVEAQPLLAVGENMSDSQEKTDCVTAESPSAAISTLISQLRPEVINSLAKIIEDVQKNTSHFYIHCADEESNVCWEIKEYLLKLGNPECDPQTFLQKQDRNGKLLVVIQNIDIDAHIHKIPALVSLKKLPSVSFAGVDSLDDIKNHTYNELFVSGGFIVSDELVLNPDFISLERLQALLSYLEELNTPESPWRWRVHCKTHKKVKELSRSKSEAQNVLSLLTIYHKKQIVEFLSYHECDSPLSQAPGLDCLVKLQAQHIRQRHVIFLTEHRFEMFPQYSSSGIVIANIDDILYSMASLIGGASDRPASLDLPSCPESPLEDDDVRTLGRMSSLEEKSFVTTNPEPVASADLELCDPEHPVRNDVAPDMAASSSATTNPSEDLDFEALKATIAQFREARLQAKSNSSRLSSPRPFDISTLQVLISQNDGTTSAQTREPTSDPAEDLSSESRTTSQTEDSCSETRDVPRPSNPTTSVKKNLVIPKTASNISTDPQPMWNKRSDPKHPDTKCSQEKNATNVNITTNSSSSNTRSMENVNQNGGAGLLPVPGVYDLNNRLVGMDRIQLQNRSLWPTTPRSFGLNGHGASSQNSAFGLRSVANRLSMVTPSGLGGILPNSHMQMAWNNLTQGTAVNMWGIQQGVRLGQVQRTQFIQGYTWHGGPPFPGSTHPPRRGGFDSW